VGGRGVKTRDTETVQGVNFANKIPFETTEDSKGRTADGREKCQVKKAALSRKMEITKKERS